MSPSLLSAPRWIHACGLALGLATVAHAQEMPPAEPVPAPAPEPAPAPTVFAEEEAPPEAPVLRNIPPRFSWEIALSASYGMMVQFDGLPWAGFGVRGGWGKQFNNHRIGPGLSITIEGPIGVEWSTNFEPAFQWDLVTEKKLWLGASAGVDLLLNVDQRKTLVALTTFDAAPMVAFRVGFSQQWSLIRRRFFIGLEPKLRIIDGKPSFVGAIVLGSGAGY